MATTRAIFLVKKNVIIGDIVNVDACMEETHTLANTVTDHPVEGGYKITDHSRPNPDIVTLRCFVSNSPISHDQVKTAVKEGAVEFNTTAPETIIGRADVAFNNLKKMRDEGQLLTVITTLRTYGEKEDEKMMIESLTIPRTSKNYDGLEFSVTLKQIRIVKNRSATDKRPREVNTQKKEKKGQKTTKPTPTTDPLRDLTPSSLQPGR